MIRKLVPAIAVAASLAAPAAAEEAWSPLIEPAALEALVEDEGAVIFDIRSVKAYMSGHVEGAVSAPYHAWRGPRDNPGAVISDEKLTLLLSEAGVEPEMPVVITFAGQGSGDFGSAARVYWTLKSAGVEQIAILNGGLSAWSAAGLPLSTEEGANFPSDLEFSLSTHWMIDGNGVADVLAGEREALLVDARPETFFQGRARHPLARLAGTLAGAVNIQHDRWFAKEGARLDLTREQALDAARASGWHPDGREVVSFCNTGHLASTNWFVLSEIAGIEGVKLYPESLVGWTADRTDLAQR